MKNLPRNLAIIIGGVLLGPLVAMAVQISVPSAPGSGYLLISTSTGAYVATTSASIIPTFSPYPFPLSGNATSTLTQFNSGLTAYASSTIGNGTATSGLTVNGGATTTGDVIFYPNGQARGGFVVDYNNPAIISPDVSHEDSITLIGGDNNFPAIYEYAFHFRTLFEGYAADGTEASPTNTKSGAELVRLGGRGYGTTGYTGTASAVSLFAAQDWSDTAQGAWVGIRTTPIGSTGGGSQQIPPVIAAFTASGGLIVGSTTTTGGGQFTYSPSNFAFYATDPGNGNIVANGITTVNATTTNATTTTLTLLGTTACNTGNALTTNALGNVVCGTTGSGSGTVGSGTTGQFPYYAASGTTLTATSSLLLAASGNVGIGNTAPLFPLHVSSNGSATIGQIALTDTNAVSSAATWLLSSQGGVFSIGTTTAAGATTTPSAISISNAGTVGIDSVAGVNTALNIAYTFPSGGGNKQGISSFPIYTGATAAARVLGTITQSTFSGTVNGTNANGSVVGGNFMAINGTNGQNVLNAYAALSQFATVGALSSTTNVADFEAQAPNTLAGTTITNYYGLQTQGATTTGAGSIANAVGINIQLMNFTNTANQTSLLIGTSTAPAGNFGIYQFDTKNNYLAGNLGIGTTSPGSLLSLGGAGTGINFYDNATSTFQKGIAAADFCTATKCLSSASAGTNYFTLTGSNIQNNVGTALGINVAPFSAALEIMGTTSDATTNAGAFWNSSASPLLIIKDNGNVGIASTSPFANLSIHSNNGSTNTTLFAIGSSTASATTTLFSVSNTGAVTAASSLVVANNIQAGSTGNIRWASRTLMLSPADGQLTLENNALNGFTRLNFGGTTSSFPALAVSGANLVVEDASGGTASFLGIGTTSPYQLLSVAGNEVVTGTVTWPALATPAGSFLAVNPLGQVIATTTPSGGSSITGSTGQFPYFSATNTLTATSSLFLAVGGTVGIGTTTTAYGGSSWTHVVSNAITGLGGLLINTATNVTNAFSIINASGATVFNVDTTASSPFLGVGSTFSTSAILSVGSTTATVGPPYFEIDTKGHVVTSGTLPTLSSCGTGTPTIQGNDTDFRITTETSASTCTVNFAQSYTLAPICFATEESGGTILVNSSSTPTGVVLTFPSALTGKEIAGRCEGYQ